MLYSPKPAIQATASPIDHTEHRIVPKSQTLKQFINRECAICMDPMITPPDVSGGEEYFPMVLLPCQHIFHRACLERCAKNECPECREDYQPGEVKTADSPKELSLKIDMRCQNARCLWEGTMQERIHASCPYPLSTFNRECTNFLQENSAALTEWLTKTVEKKGLDVSNVKCGPYWHSSNSANPPKDNGCYAIHFRVNHKKLLSARKFYYTETTINKGSNAAECFQLLLEDMRTDLVTMKLRLNYPNAFNRSSTLCIRKLIMRPGTDPDYAYPDGVLVINSHINGPIQLPLMQIWDPAKPQFSFDKLKKTMEEQGLNYAELFQGNSLIDTDESATVSPEECQPNEEQTPSGEMDLTLIP